MRTHAHWCVRARISDYLLSPWPADITLYSCKDVACVHRPSYRLMHGLAVLHSSCFPCQLVPKDGMDNNETTAFADWVSTTARGFGYKTDAALAQAIGVQQSTVTRWRHGNQPQIKHLVALAYLFRMRIDPLLAMSGHVPADLLGDSEPAGPPMTESVRRIRDAPLADMQKDALTRYWNKRLDEERSKLFHLIDMAAYSNDGKSKQEIGQALLHAVLRGTHSIAHMHLVDLVQELMAVEAAPRKRRRRSSPDEDEGTDPVPFTDEGRSLEPSEKTRLELEP